MSILNCRNCDSLDLVVVKSGPHNKLICANCLSFQTFLSKSKLKTFIALQKEILWIDNCNVLCPSPSNDFENSELADMLL